MESRDVSVLATARQHVALDPSVTERDQDPDPHGPVSEQRVVVGPHRRGLGLLSVAICLLGAWGAIVPYVGPSFGYRANGSGSFRWSAAHSLLYLAPGAFALGCGLLLLVLVVLRGRGLPIMKALAAIGVIAAGAWFVLGPEVWPIFSTSVVFGPATGALTRFVNQVGYNLGLGFVLGALGAVLLARPGTDGYLIRSRSARPVTAPAAVATAGE
jgi:hypothetical protein